MTKDDAQEKPQFYDVERFQKIYSETSKARGRLGRLVNKVLNVLDSMQGFFVALIGLPIMFGTLGAVVLGSYYGPWAFVGIMGSIIGGVALYAERKVGQSLQFAEFGFRDFLRRTLATGIAFFVALGIIYFLVFLSRFKLF